MTSTSTAFSSPNADDQTRVRMRDYAAITSLLLASRAILLIVGYMAASHQGDPVSLRTIFCRFDCNWYLSIADHGYSVQQTSNQPGATNFGFFPLFPLLVRGVAWLFGGTRLLAGIISSNICFLIALVYVYRYALLVGATRTAALLACALICVFPQSFAFSAPYSESLFMLLLGAAIFHMLRKQFLAAAIAAALLSATRPTGVLFIIFALVWTLQSVGVRSWLMPWQRPQLYLPIVFAPLGMFAFWGYCFVVTGDAFAQSHTELHGWGYRFMFPWQGLWMLVHLDARSVVATIVSFAVFACSLLLLPRRRYTEFALCLSFFLLMWSTPTIGSIFRYWLVLFPIWVEVARRLEQRPMLATTILLSLSLINGVMMWEWTLQDLFAI